MRPLAALTLLILVSSGPLGAQAVVDPGMTKAQVIATLGSPAAEKSSATATYLYYKNGVERTVGMSDVVVLENDMVVDAILRSTARKYSGKSSSPAAIPAEEARKRAPTPPPQMAEPAMPAAAPAAPATSAAKEAQKMPAERAQEAKVAVPVPQARSAILEREKAAAKAADSAKAAKAAKPDSAAPPKKRP